MLRDETKASTALNRANHLRRDFSVVSQKAYASAGQESAAQVLKNERRVGMMLSLTADAEGDGEVYEDGCERFCNEQRREQLHVGLKKADVFEAAPGCIGCCVIERLARGVNAEMKRRPVAFRQRTKELARAAAYLKRERGVHAEQRTRGQGRKLFGMLIEKKARPPHTYAPCRLRVKMSSCEPCQVLSARHHLSPAVLIEILPPPQTKDETLHARLNSSLKICFTSEAVRRKRRLACAEG